MCTFVRPRRALLLLLCAASVSAGCATTRLGRGTPTDSCGERGEIGINERVEGQLGAAVSCRSTRERWFNEYELDIDEEQSIQIVLTSAEEVEVTFIDPGGDPEGQFETDGTGDPLDFVAWPERVKPGKWVIQVATDSYASYVLTIYDKKFNLEGTCWIPDATELELGEPLKVSRDQATCMLDGGKRAVIRKFEVSDVSDVTMTADTGTSMRLLNEEGTTVMWIEGENSEYARFAKTFAPGTYYMAFGFPPSDDLSVSTWERPSLVRTPPTPDYMAKEHPGCDDPSRRQVLKPGMTITGRLDTESCHRIMEPHDFNAYALEVPKRTLYKLVMESDRFPAMIVVEDLKERELADAARPGVTSTELVVALEPGTYLVRASQAYPTAEGSYTLSLEEVTDPKRYEFQIEGHVGPDLWQIQGDSFFAKLPGHGHKSQKQSWDDGEDGTVSMETWSFKVDDGTVYLVRAVDFPTRWISSEPPEQILEDMRAAIVAETSGKVLRTSPLPPMKEKYPGEEFVVEAQSTIEGRTWLVGARVYQLLMVIPKGRTPYEKEKFFEALELVRPPPPLR